MDKIKKIKIAAAVFVIVCILTFIICIVITNIKNKESGFTIDGINLPKHQEVLKDKIINDLKISEVSILTREKISTFKANVSNNTENDITIKSLSVVFYENKNETKIEVLRDATIKSNENEQINIVSELDLTNVTKIEYVVE